MRFREEDIITFRIDGETFIGEVKKVGENIVGETILLVETEDKELKKIFARDAILCDSEDPDKEITSITISKEDFNKAVAVAINPLNYDMSDPRYTIAVSLAGMIVCERLGKELFK